MAKKKKQSIYMHKQDEWAELYRQGMSFRKIAEQEGIGYATVQNVIKDVIEPRPKEPFTQVAEEWAKRYEEGWSTQEIGEKYQVSPTTVHKYLKRMGMEFRRQRTAQTRKYDHLVEEWIDLYQQGKSLKEIAEQFDIHPSVVHAYIEDKTQMREYSETSRQHTAKDHYFDVIDTTVKAYWLGFVFSNGCLIRGTGGFAVQVSVAEKDKERLDRFRDVLESDNPYDVHRPDTTPFYQLRINSKHLFEAMESHGLKEEKRDSLSYPETLDPAFHSAFILGYYEGKGSCFNRLKKNRKTPHTNLQLFGTESILKSIQDIIQQQVQVTLDFRWRKAQLNGRVIRYCILATGVRAEIEKLAEWLYQDKTEHSRKRDIREILKQAEKLNKQV